MHNVSSSRGPARLGLVTLLAVGALACGPDTSSGNDAGGSATAADVTAAPPTEETSPTDAVTSDGVADAPPTTSAPSRAPAQTVASADGVVSLDLPEGAVELDVEVAIESVEPNEGELSAYALTPDGLALTSPARLTIQVGDEMLGATDELIRAIALNAQESSLGEVTVDPALATFTADIGTLRRIGLGGSIEVDGRQVTPGPSTPVGESFTAEYEFNTVAGDSVAVRSGEWYPFDGGLIGLEGRCDEAGPFDRRAAFALDQVDPLVDSSLPSMALVSVRTLCEEPPRVTELRLGPPVFDVPHYEGPMYIRTGTDEGVQIGWTTEDVPDGGTIGFTAVSDDGGVFAECLIERRAGQRPGPRCAMSDSTGALLEFVELEQSEVDGVLYINLPPSSFDPVLQQILLGASTLIFREIDVNRYAANGEHSQGLVDAAELMSGMHG